MLKSITAGAVHLEKRLKISGRVVKMSNCAAYVITAEGSGLQYSATFRVEPLMGHPNVEAASLSYAANFPKRHVLEMIKALKTTFEDEGRKLAERRGQPAKAAIPHDLPDTDLEDLYVYGLEHNGLMFVWNVKTGVDSGRFLEAMKRYCKNHRLGFQNASMS